MAKSSADGFEYYGSITGRTENPVPRRFLIATSTTLKINDAVRVNTSGYLVPAGVGYPILGILVGLVNSKGINVLGHGFVNNVGATLTGDDTVTTASDNTSRAEGVYGQVVLDPAGDCLWLNDASGTLTQAMLLACFDVDAADSRTINVSSVSDSDGQFQLVQLDPDATGGKAADVSKGLFRIVQNQLVTQLEATGQADPVQA